MYGRYTGVSLRRIENRRRRIKILRLALFSILPVIAFGLIVFVFRLPNLRIENIRIVGNIALTEGEVRKKVRENIAGNYFYVFPRDNVALLPRGKLRGELLNSFKNIQLVKISIDDLNVLTVSLEERKPFALWCRKESDCYFLDENAYVFGKAPDFSGPVFLRFYKKVEEEPLGLELLPISKFKDLMFFIDSLRREDFIVESVSILDDGVFEAHLEGGGRLIFNDKQDYSVTLSNLKVLVESDTFKEKMTGGKLSIDYIDLQHGNKIFYKPSK